MSLSDQLMASSRKARSSDWSLVSSYVRDCRGAAALPPERLSHVVSCEPCIAHIQEGHKLASSISWNETPSLVFNVLDLVRELDSLIQFDGIVKM